ncbi:NRAMP family divalent metal transporter [Streptococcus loxodontisalivarius]|uniref:Mn2+/Fe2+ NRAMP family transporter n=1 Tax=Streptococcus loxodontisalivarius TaxID=1349415 RepID=A0ABS2PV43_9STRE|nr:NRAMP family divalent metal transporter [Streptococcus loxodontisalivarius]MBM7643324.1 Mn2+/Fe2+ NRAMP family transporter [Streptococcus loxodontisalivarius]
MTENTNHSSSTWRTKLKAMGPGILMASAAVGGSHIVSSTQAGAIYGWQLSVLVLLINLFKYPFFRFGSQYTAENGKNLIEGYAEKGKIYLIIYFILNIFSAVVNTAGVGILCAAIVANFFPGELGISTAQLTTIIIVIIWGMLLLGGYRFLDGLSKWIMTALTIATVGAVVIALFQHREYAPDFVVTSPWQMAALPFLVSLMGWMPAPIEISTINSLWSVEKRKTVDFNEEDALFDFNVGYIGTAILAFFFLALGALIQYGNGEQVQSASAAYIAQFVSMYASAFGNWAKPFITFIAFLCIFGTVITVIDGYSRANNEALRLLTGKKESSQKALTVWMTVTAIAGLVIVYAFSGQVATMLRFAMIASFITTPFFAYLNYSLVDNEKHRVTGWLKWLSITGLIYLFGFAIFFVVAWLTGNV